MWNSQSSIRHFTRGGQTFLHNFRMMNQIFNRLSVFCVAIFIISMIAACYLLTTEYQRYVLEQWVVANVFVFFDDKSTQDFLNPNGMLRKALSQDVVQAGFIHHILQDISKAVLNAFYISLVMMVVCFIGIHSIFNGKIQ